MCHCNEHKLTALQIMRPEQNTTLRAKTEQLRTAKISGNALKQGVKHTQCYFSAVHNCDKCSKRLHREQWSKTHSTPRHDSSQLWKHRAAWISRPIVVEQRRYPAGMADTEGWEFESATLDKNWKCAWSMQENLRFLLYGCYMYNYRGDRTDTRRACVSRYDQSAWTVN